MPCGLVATHSRAWVLLSHCLAMATAIPCGGIDSFRNTGEASEYARAESGAGRSVQQRKKEIQSFRSKCWRRGCPPNFTPVHCSRECFWKGSKPNYNFAHNNGPICSGNPHPQHSPLAAASCSGALMVRCMVLPRPVRTDAGPRGLASRSGNTEPAN